MALAKLAADAQLRYGYRADVWIELKVPALTKLWQGVNDDGLCTSDFFLSEEDARGGARVLRRLASRSASRRRSGGSRRSGPAPPRATARRPQSS